MDFKCLLNIVITVLPFGGAISVNGQRTGNTNAAGSNAIIAGIVQNRSGGKTSTLIIGGNTCRDGGYTGIKCLEHNLPNV